MSDDAQEWRWVGEDGVVKTVKEQELIAELSSESLPGYTLVWKPGWLEWLPAMQIGELSWALPPGKADEPVKPREKPAANQPPAPPLYRYPVLKRRASNLRSGAPPPPMVGVPRPASKDASPQAPRPTPPAADVKIEPSSASASPPPAPPPSDPLGSGPPPKAPPPADPPSDALGSGPIDPPSYDSNPGPLPAKVSAPFEPPTIALARSDAEVTRPGRQASPEPPTTEWNPMDSRPFEEVDMSSIEASSPFAAKPPLPDFRSLDSDPSGLMDDTGDGGAARFSGLSAARAPLLGSAYGEEDDAETRVLPSKPPPPGPQYVAPRAPPAAEGQSPDYDDLSAMPKIPALPAAPADLAAYARLPGAREGDPERAFPWKPFAIAATVAAIGAAVVVSRSGGEAESVTAGAGSASPSAVAAPPPTPPAAAERYTGQECRPVSTATRISEWADPGVPPAFAKVPGSERVVVGFAQTDVYAIGITIEPRTLDRDQVFRESRKDRIESVVPTVDRGQLHFQVTRRGSSLQLSGARAVDATIPFYLGLTEGGVARVVGKSTPHTLWPLPDSSSSVLRVGTVSGFGHVVALRRGGQSGPIVAGWLEPSGEKKTELAEIPVKAERLGTPAVASNEATTLFAFAARATGDGPWRVVLGTAKNGEVPRETRTFQLPPGGPGGDGMSPSVGALAGGRWLLQWTEGSSGNRAARAQVLASDLTPLSPPLNVSSPGANAGQGSVWSSGDVAAVLYYVQTERKTHELWGQSIECPQ